MTETTDAKPTTNAKTDVLPSALSDAGQRLLGLLVQRAAEAAADRVTSLSDRLTSVTENGGRGLTEALLGRDSGGADGGSPQGALGRGLGTLKEKAKDLVGGGNSGGRGKKLKVTNIVEDIDVGLPLRTTYDLWTQFADFPSFMKKVESVEQEADERTNWKAQVLWSHRAWEATVVEQVPDSHIVWRSKAAKGHVDGAITFTEIGRNLTRVLFVMEYHPQGFFEHTGNIWRAQGRRARLEIKHFRRHAMSTVLLEQQEVEGWRGEIHDGEVVKTHEQALEEEAAAREEPADREEPAAREEPGGPDEEGGAAGADYEDEAEYPDEDEAEPEDVEPADYEDEYEDEDEGEGEYEAEGEYEDEDEDEDEDEPAQEENVADEQREPETARSTRGARR